MSGEMTRKDPPNLDSDDVDERAAALTGPELAHLEALLPTEVEAEVLAYMRGAGLVLADLVALQVHVGAADAQIEHQAAYINSLQVLQARATKVLADLKAAASHRKKAPPK